MKIYSALKVLAPLVIGLAGFTAAQAGPLVTDWNYSLSGVWNSFAPAGVSNPNSKTLIWGTSTGSGQSSLVITDPAAGAIQTQITGTSPVPGTTAAGVTLTHNNNPITGTTLTNAELRVTLNLSAALPANTPGIPGILPALNYDILFSETPNSTPCAVVTSPIPCNDIFVQQTGFLNQVLPFDGNTYFINIFPTSGGVLGVLSNAACAAAGAANGCLGFTTIEGQSNTLAFGFTISTQRLTQQIPEPSILALLGIALAAGWFASRRRKQQH
jgi:hypothetical protein